MYFALKRKYSLIEFIYEVSSHRRYKVSYSSASNLGDKKTTTALGTSPAKSEGGQTTPVT